MGEMSKRTKLLILGVIVVGIALVIASDPQNPNTLPALLFLSIPLLIALLASLPPHLKALLNRYLFVIVVGIMITAVIILLVKYLRMELSSGLFIILFWPLLLLVLWVFVVLYLGPFLAIIGQVKLAEKLYSGMLRLNSKFGFAYFQRGVLRHSQKDFDVALQDYDKALDIAKIKESLARPSAGSINYSSAAIYGNKADIYLHKHDPQQAILECNMGLSLHENQPAINLLLLYRRGYAQLVTGNYDGALQDLNSLHFEGKAAAQEKNFAPDINALKAISLAGLDRIDEAKTLWAKAIAANPEFNKSEWLVQTRLWPSNLLSLAEKLR